MNAIAQVKSHVLLSATMTKSGLPKSIRKFIRKEKARIRGGILGIGEQKEQIAKLYEKYLSFAKATNHAAKSHTGEFALVQSITSKGEELTLVKKQVKKLTPEKKDKPKAKKPKV